MLGCQPRKTRSFVRRSFVGGDANAVCKGGSVLPPLKQDLGRESPN